MAENKYLDLPELIPEELIERAKKLSPAQLCDGMAALGIERNGCMEGIGKPEPLTGDLQGEYSRRINDKDRLVYHMENGRIYIAHCRGHYGDK